MEKTIGSKGHKALVELISQKRKSAGMKQDDLAAALGQTQPWVAHLESGQRRIDVVEFVKLADVIGFDAVEELKAIIPLMLEPSKPASGR